MAEIVYALCGLMSIACAGMLFRGYRRTPSHLLLWSSVCFGFLVLNNAILVFDMLWMPDYDFQGALWRNALGAVAGSVLLFGLIWELT